MKSVTVLGSTGSVGKSTLDLLAANPGLYDVVALTAQSNVDLLARQARTTRAKLAVIGDESLYQDLKDRLAGTGTEVAAGADAIVNAAALKADWSMAAIVGMAGLKPMMAALKQGAQVAIANKEPLVAAGAIVMEEARLHGATLLPVDSEHNAIFQVFEERNRARIRRLILTASGGPFRDKSVEEMARVTKAEALNHPNWSMGPKISIDSATMMNKGLEVIEAHHLFAMPAAQIEVLLHPQSVIHSMVEYEDGSVLAQLGPPDMRVPIAHALGWPERIKNTAQPLDLQALSELTFARPDLCRFPAIKLAYDCLAAGQGACAALNAANEVAVAAFLDEEIGFGAIVGLVAETLAQEKDSPRLDTIDAVIAYDREVRGRTKHRIINRHDSNRKAL